MSTTPRVHAAQKAPKQITAYIKQCRVIIDKSTGNPDLPNPLEPLTLASAALDLLETAEQNALKGPKGAAQDRDAKLGVVRTRMRVVIAYVQTAADANPARARAIIESAGLTVVTRTPRRKPNLAAKYGTIPGRIVLEGKAVRGASYHWQMSIDQKTWTDLPESVKATLTVDGLTPATTYSFRFRTLTKDGLSDWSGAVSVIAH